MKTIVVVTYGYPSEANPTSLTFLKELVDQWRDIGIVVRVINPLTSKFHRMIKNSETADISYPSYIDYGILKIIPFFSRIRRYLSNRSFRESVKSMLPHNDDIVLYAHFLNAGYIVAQLSDLYGYPAYCAFGESTLWSIKDMNLSHTRKLLKNIKGFISVSRENSDILINNGLSDTKNIILLPNGIDIDKFYPRDKYVSRKKFNIDSEIIVGVFLGSFIERKGVLRVNEATRNVSNLKMMYIGNGPQDPQGNNIIFKGRVEHINIPDYLSAADFFILPTEAEGCSNAILEAMACGLPIISSIGKFNDDILDESYSIRVDPYDIQQLEEAILKLSVNKDLRVRMSEAAVKRAKEFDIKKRAKLIAKYIEVIQ